MVPQNPQKSKFIKAPVHQAPFTTPPRSHHDSRAPVRRKKRRRGSPVLQAYGCDQAMESYEAFSEAAEAAGTKPTCRCSRTRCNRRSLKRHMSLRKRKEHFLWTWTQTGSCKPQGEPSEDSNGCGNTRSMLHASNRHAKQHSGSRNEAPQGFACTSRAPRQAACNVMDACANTPAHAVVQAK